jgi:FkbM family methyltransferase
MILLTGLYQDADARRSAELLECLQRNIENDRLEEIHVFVEDSIKSQPLMSHPPLTSPKIRLIQHGRRVTYRDLFANASERLAGCRVIIANADIFFDHTLACLDGYDLSGKLLCLSRWDLQPDGSARFFEHPSSQDAWIFQSPIREFPCDFHLGVLGCDNRLAWEAESAGLAVSNPSRSVRANHLHLSGIRRYNGRQRLTGPTKSIPAVFLETPYSSPMNRESIYALTSLSPLPENAPFLRTCIESWRAAGLQVRAFNHPAEIAELTRLYDLDFVPVAETTASVFGGHFIPIKAMLDWAQDQDAPVLLINSDIHLRMEEWEMKRVRWLSGGGLCYFVRYNHNGNAARADREPYGIDAFLLHGRDATLFPESFLSMGQPFWDYWLPHTFASQSRPIYTVEFPAAFHRNHRSRWSWENWHRCALEFARITGELYGDQSFEACKAMSLRVRQNFDRQKVSVPRLPFRIREWVQHTFRYPGPKTFLELGAHQGTDTEWMAEIPDVTMHAFEPDPRNHQAPRPNVTLHRAAIAERDGSGPLILSKEGWGQQWTHSSSIKQPKNHLARYPVTFGEAVEVECIALDNFRERQRLDLIDFIWADIQGAEGEMIRGAAQTLSRTRYLYTEYSDDELYENQMPLNEILKLLPDFRVIELWADDVLLENRKLKA